MSRRLAATLIATVRARAGHSQAELARRAAMPRSVLNAYERGTRDPGAEALGRIARAAGLQLAVARRAPVDPDRANAILMQVLDLAEALPSRRRALRFPPFHSRLAA